MHALDPQLDLAGFFSRLRHARERVLMLDYDGTLAPFHIDPRLALPYPRACAVLREVLADTATRVVIVSGRRFEDLRAPLALLPHTEVWASHGWERAVGGSVARRIPSSAVRGLLSRAESLVRPLLASGARIESKVASIAIHWRGLSPALREQVRRGASTAWQPLAGRENQLGLEAFDGGLELRALGRDKGHAVREVLSTCGDGAVCAYLGDDLADERAFAAIRGRGLAVLVREQCRRTAAELWLSRRHELMGFLEKWRAEVEAA